MSAFSLNFFALTFNTDLWVTRSRHTLATIRRTNTIILILLATLVATIVVSVHSHWCCYPLDAGIDHYTLGWCIAEDATIFTDSAYATYRIANYGDCGVHTYQEWEWIFIGLLSASCLLFVVSYVFSSYFFAEDLHSDTIWQMKEILYVMDMSFPDTENVKKYLDNIEKEYHELPSDDSRKHARKQIGSSPITALRLPFLWADPIAFIFDTPGFMWKPKWLTIGVRWSCHALIILLVVIFTYSTKPDWEKRCCYPESGRFADAHLGECTDSSSVISTSSIDRTCDSKTWNWNIWLELLLGIILLVVSMSIYLNSFFVEYHDATIDAREYVSDLYTWVNASKKSAPYINDFVAFNRIEQGRAISTNTPKQYRDTSKIV